MFKIFDAFIVLKDNSGRSGKELERVEVNKVTETHVFGENYDGYIHKILKDDIFRMHDYVGCSVDFRNLKGGQYYELWSFTV